MSFIESDIDQVDNPKQESEHSNKQILRELCDGSGSAGW